MKTSIIKLAALFLIILLANSCTKDSNSDGGSTKNEVITAGGSITVKGSSNYEFTVDLEAAAYIITFKEKEVGHLENVEIYIEVFGGWTDWMPGSIMALRESNWYEGSWTQSYSAAGTFKFKVTATGEFEVVFQKLPLSQAAVNIPQNYTGAGATIFGPISLTGQASFSVNCSDAIAGFSVILLDATTGEILVNPDHTNLFTNVDDNYQVINSFNTTVIKTGLSGNYLINVIANMNAKYTVGVQ